MSIDRMICQHIDELVKKRVAQELDKRSAKKIRVLVRRPITFTVTLQEYFEKMRPRDYPDIMISPRQTAGVVLICENRLLTVFDNVSKKFSFPHGKLTPTDDSVLSGAFRKLVEVTGVKLKPFDFPWKCVRILFCFCFVGWICESCSASLVLAPRDSSQSVQWSNILELQIDQCDAGLVGFLKKIK